jgi:hypothetical protein
MKDETLDPHHGDKPFKHEKIGIFFTLKWVPTTHNKIQKNIIL